MSLGKLLSTGRSLIGGAPGEGRYNISNANRLPKFGSVKNPFAPSVPSEARAATSTTESADEVVDVARVSRPCEQEFTGETPVPLSSHPDCEIVDERIAEFLRQSESDCQPVRHEDTQRIPELAEQPVGRVSEVSVEGVAFGNRLKAGLRAVAVVAAGWMKIIWRVARAGAVAGWAAVRRFEWRASLQVCRSMAGAAWTLVRRAGPLSRVAWEKLKFILLKLGALFRRREQQEPKPLFPRFGKSVQAELSLDSIKVVRNNLEDSDLEIVTSKTRTSTQIAPTTPVAQPKRGPVPAALKKMTGIIAGPKAG